ncbi:acyl-CoA dehydrogenase family protein [Metabacillus litoralis]|uniref:acyl-CoA dehydrogenase family protein n=1 Tax=Metabacillus litoralis TaxID=152268 RepID=UPI000EF5AB25|nr:acyl-CoA dehydrogenase family protein [Metabacillus litoralis]
MLREKEKLHYLNNDVELDEVFIPEEFNQEHEMMKDLVEKFVVKDVRPSLQKIENQQFDETVRLLKEAGALGLISADIPEAVGGLGLGKVSATILSEKMAPARSFAITFGGQTGIGALPIAYFGTDKQKEKYLPAILTGDLITAYALTEPGAGTDAMNIKTTAVTSECNRYYILNGEKQWISNAGFAGLFIVFAKVEGERFTAFIIEKNFDGVSIGPEEKKMGLKGSSTCSVILDNVKVPKENIIGEIGRGHIIALNVLNIGRHKIAATSLGTAKHAIELAITYANQRRQFGKPLSSFHLIKDKIADMVIKTYVNESSIYRTAGLLEKSFNQLADQEDVASAISNLAVECSINKVMSTETLDFVVDEALQMHGGYGYMTEYEIETLYRDSRITRIFEGTNEINRLNIASTILKTYEKPIEQTKAQDGILIQEKQTLHLLKKLYHAMIFSIQKYDLVKLNEEQEVAAFLADLVSCIYAIESAILRTEKVIKLSGFDRNQQKLDYTILYTHEQSQQLAIRALNLLPHLGDEESLSQLACRLVRSSQKDFVKAKRRIADFIIKEEKYKS